MTDVSDWNRLDDDREPDAPEEYEEPLDLDELVATLADAKNDLGELGPATAEVLAAVPDLIDELRKAREQLAYWRALPLREEYAVTDGFAPTEDGRRYPREAAESAAEVLGSTAWVRSVTVHPWQDLAAGPPF